jgi:hypothetical protein
VICLTCAAEYTDECCPQRTDRTIRKIAEALGYHERRQFFVEKVSGTHFLKITDTVSWGTCHPAKIHLVNIGGERGLISAVGAKVVARIVSGTDDPDPRALRILTDYLEEEWTKIGAADAAREAARKDMVSGVQGAAVATVQGGAGGGGGGLGGAGKGQWNPVEAEYVRKDHVHCIGGSGGPVGESGTTKEDMGIWNPTGEVNGGASPDTMSSYPMTKPVLRCHLCGLDDPSDPCPTCHRVFNLFVDGLDVVFKNHGIQVRVNAEIGPSSSTMCFWGPKELLLRVRMNDKGGIFSWENWQMVKNRVLTPRNADIREVGGDVFRLIQSASSSRGGKDKDVYMNLFIKAASDAVEDDITSCKDNLNRIVGFGAKPQEEQKPSGFDAKTAEAITSLYAAAAQATIDGEYPFAMNEGSLKEQGKWRLFVQSHPHLFWSESSAGKSIANLPTEYFPSGEASWPRCIDKDGNVSGDLLDTLYEFYERMREKSSDYEDPYERIVRKDFAAKAESGFMFLGYVDGKVLRFPWDKPNKASIMDAIEKRMLHFVGVQDGETSVVVYADALAVFQDMFLPKDDSELWGSPCD